MASKRGASLSVSAERPLARAHRGVAGRQSRRSQQVSSATKVSVDNYRDDPLYPRIVRVVEALLARGNFVSPVDVLVGLGLLEPAKLEDWRRGRVPYLEMVINCNLTRLSRFLRILRIHAHDLNLVPSATAYMRWGNGPKHRLRFSKTGHGKLEEAYSRHFVWPGKGPFHAPGLAPTNPTEAASDSDGQSRHEKEHRA